MPTNRAVNNTGSVDTDTDTDTVAADTGSVAARIANAKAAAARSPRTPAPTGADPGPPHPAPNNIRPTRLHPHELGKRGEDLAAGYLESEGLVILSRNWRCRDGELDMVATDGNALVVCEVKTRSSEDFGTPAEAVHPTKAHRIRRATYEWLRRYGVHWCPVRFDVLAIIWPPNEPPRLEHLRGVFS